MGSRVAINPVSSFLVSTGSAPRWRTLASDVQNVAQTTSSTSYVSLSLPSVTASTGTDAIVLLQVGDVSNDTAGEACRVSVDVSGASTIAATNSRSAIETSNAANDQHSIFFMLHYGDIEGVLTAGSNVFQMQVSVTGGTGSFDNCRLSVLSLS